ncbi:unnamed protein product [Rotaria sp. Silwood1]|nr:unnamed protein product [Rotaria sp. Silwood1]CAF1629979.1 unnamed protein product [Rotaria sp. Silwood1]
MNNDDHISYLWKSSLNISTNTQEKQLSNSLNLLNKNRRKSIIPSTHLPIKVPKLFQMDTEQDNLLNKDCSSIETEKPTQSNINSFVTTTMNNNTDKKDLLPKDMVENDADCEENETENNFDLFILQNFTPFSGEQDVNQWLSETKRKFNRLLIPRNLRSTAIPLLVEGPAEKVYILNRRNIQSFEDFYEILLLHFDKDVTPSALTDPQESVFSQSSLLHQVKSSEDKNLQTMMTFDNTNFSEKPPKHHSTALNDSGAATSNGEIPAFQSTVVNDNNTINHSTTTVDDTTNAIRKVLLHNLIQNPKTFQGGKDDVTKWLEDLEHSFDTAHIPDANKLDLISYSLRGEALRWYKNNKSTLTSWQLFVSEFKKAFTSSYHEELAFQKLEAYTQGENQSIRNYYNEVIKLCKEADPAMSESAKLRYLLNKTKPTIQFEVRRKKPTTTKEFLEYAKEIEDLYQLSNITINTNTNTNINSNTNTTSPTLPFTSIPSMIHNYSNSFSTMSQPQNWKKFNNNYPNNYYKNNFRTSYPLLSYNSSFQPRQSTFSSTKSPISSRSSPKIAPQPFRPNQQRSSNTYTTNNNKQPNTQQRPKTFSRNNPRQTNVSSLLPLDDLIQPNLQQSSTPTDYCTQCKQFGHQASACPNF